MSEHEVRPGSIVVGIELDDTGDEALLHAARLARTSDAQLHLCHACGEPSGDSDANVALLKEGQTRLAAWAGARLAGDPLKARCSVHVDLGPPAEVLVQLAVDTAADLIVVGSHRKGLLERLREGSVVRQVLTDAPCAVLIALPRDYEERVTSPQIEPAPVEGEHVRGALRRGRGYSYRMSIALPGQPTIGPGKV